MSETALLAIAGSLVATMFGLLCALLAYLGTNAIKEMQLLREALQGMDKRLTIVETTCELKHNAWTGGGTS